MELRAGAARTGFTHRPEVVFLAAGMDLLGGQVFKPKLTSFDIGFEAFFFVAFKIGRVQTGWVKFPDIHEQFPGPVDGFGFEVVAK